ASPGTRVRLPGRAQDEGRGRDGDDARGRGGSGVGRGARVLGRTAVSVPAVSGVRPRPWLGWTWLNPACRGFCSGPGLWRPCPVCEQVMAGWEQTDADG